METDPIIIKIPIRLISEANNTDFWRVKWKRKKNNELLLKSYFNHAKVKAEPPCDVTLCRIAPRELDEEDNLRTAFKPIKDWIADRIIPGLAPGRADGDKRIKWHYTQEKGKILEYAIKITIQCYPNQPK